MIIIKHQHTNNPHGIGEGRVRQAMMLLALILLLVVQTTVQAAGNIAGLAGVSASSESISTQQLAIKAIDSVISGYPVDYTREWVTTGERAGAWLELNWGTPYAIDRVVLYDRPLLNNQITQATLTFSDGSSVSVGALDNAAGPTEITFTPRAVTWMRMTVNAVSATTSNVGLAEIEVFGSPAPVVNEPPTANAGPDQLVAEDAFVRLSGSGTDPNGDTLSYQWTQTAGTTVTLSSRFIANPSFTAPAGNDVLRFALVTSDADFSSAADSVDITVQAGTPASSNIATLASVSASTESVSTTQLAIKAIDNVISGYPVDYTREWVTTGERAGAWLELNWGTPYTVDRVVLYDRPLLNNQITQATLTFSDGSSVSVGALDNAAGPTEITFTPRAVTWMRMTVNAVSATTSNVGLAEIEVFGSPAPVVNEPPTANAGPDQLVAEDAFVRLSGSGTDPNGDTLSYQWTQTAGTTVTLSSRFIASPTFTAPAGNDVLRFALVTSDAEFSSAADSVDITVQAGTPASSNIATLASVSASTESVSTTQLAIKAIDNVISGYPVDYTREWVTTGERAGAWLELNWGTPYTVDRVVLYDRPLLNNQITQATLTFSDGSSVSVGALDNAAGPTEITFTPRAVTWMRMTVNAVSATTSNVGLAEIEVFGSPAPVVNEPPTANAGPDQLVAEDAFVRLSGSGTDPNGDTLSYQWTQTAGTTVTLSSRFIASPTFTAPAGNDVLRFALVTSDAEFSSAADSVDITVQAGTPASSNIATLASVSASTESVSTTQLAIKAIDNVISGYPVDYTREWVTTGERAGAWLELNWGTPYTVDRVVLYDRPLLNNQITQATLTFSDGSSVSVGALDNAAGPTEITFTPRAVTWMRMTVNAVSATTSNVGLAEIEVFGTPAAIDLPYTDDFANGSGEGWFIDDESAVTSDWNVINSTVTQFVNVGKIYTPNQQSYHLGSILYYANLASLTDFSFSVDVTGLDKSAQGIGILFRYRDSDNYYRFSMNSRFGFSRLEKKVNGQFTTLASNSRGYRVANGTTMKAIVQGSQIHILLDGDPLFAVTDSSITNGTIGLYSQTLASFENVLVQNADSAPLVTLSAPLAHSVDTDARIDAAALALNVPAGGYVEFTLDNGVPVIDNSAPYTARFTGVAQGEHKVDAILRNAADLEIGRDSNHKVGMRGDNYVALGDSITDGVEDNYSADNSSNKGRIIAVQGYESVLTDLLDSALSPTPHIVVNEGVGGDDSGDTPNRINSILARNPGTNRVLILLGSNDSGGSMPRPSGSGCSGTACNGTFKGNIQALVNSLPAGVNATVALVPPVFAASSSSTPYADPLPASRNNTHQQYNSVIRNELTNIQTGPDLFSAFLTPTQNLFSLFTDYIHPNALGYVYLAHQWHNALNPGNTELPFILDELSPSIVAPYLKQNLLEAGDRYYVDNQFTLASIPAELDGAVWVMTANADKANTSSRYVSFDIDRPVTVYIAYDADATTLPDWLKPANGFSSTGSQLTVNGDALTSQFDLYSKDYPAGSVTDLGGNLAAGANGADSNYLVIIKPQ